MFMNLIFTRKWNIIGNPQHVPHMGHYIITRDDVMLCTVLYNKYIFSILSSIYSKYYYILYVIPGQIEYCPHSTTRPRSR